MRDEKLCSVLAVPILIVSLTTACGPNTTAPTTTTTTPTTPTVPAGTFAGRALQAGASNPIAAAVVTMSQADVPVTITTDASGAFSFTGLTAGAATLQVTAPGFVGSTSTVTVPQTGYVVNLAPVSAPTPPTLVSLSVTGNAVLTAAGQTSQLVATTVRSDGVRADVTSVAKWTTSVPHVVQVSSTGLVTAFAAGQTVVTATFRDVSGTLNISVNIP